MLLYHRLLLCVKRHKSHLRLSEEHRPFQVIHAFVHAGTFVLVCVRKEACFVKPADTPIMMHKVKRSDKDIRRIPSPDRKSGNLFLQLEEKSTYTGVLFTSHVDPVWSLGKSLNVRTHSNFGQGELSEIKVGPKFYFFIKCSLTNTSCPKLTCVRNVQIGLCPKLKCV